MILGFISLLLTFGQTYISRICIPTNVANTMLPCKFDGPSDSSDSKSSEEEHRRRLLWFEHRYLASTPVSTATQCKEVSVLLSIFSCLAEKFLGCSYHKFLICRVTSLLYRLRDCTNYISSYSFWLSFMLYTVLSP